jgi:hypothetical protein
MPTSTTMTAMAMPGGGDRTSRFNSVHRSQIRGLVAGRRQSHLEVDNGNVPAGLHGGDDNYVVPPPPQDQGSQRRSIVVVVIVIVLSIPSRCLPDGQIDNDDGDDGNDTGAVAEQSRSQDESTSARGVDPTTNGGGGTRWGLLDKLAYES